MLDSEVRKNLPPQGAVYLAPFYIFIFMVLSDFQTNK
ncbi:hypothetical protein B6N60_02328 [Richelia sinica FACHB-800]|uniref:Uncharacterized protein n=1 Tax=Richelia sinica FACHB-800 TaxID=1357546 RepID=A0A975Y4X7_9NOST|nr:hypothetical protein B6N60_02328 [Richelia sinica FACHB-800]